MSAVTTSQNLFLDPEEEFDPLLANALAALMAMEVSLILIHALVHTL
ncbi:hypothetical protein [Mangrovibrevibacter kandeliae]|nr:MULTISPECIES: hypothetical protein [unclassified Aurantimonas]MCQ8781511.1 hypothetical protein [Aurantimonas sp. CSK15Z-1]MCW4114287.1 hypothetical protein [Aurantimonas sp. MSK8Z-1]